MVRLRRVFGESRIAADGQQVRHLPLIVLAAVVLAGCIGIAPPKDATDSEVLRTIARHLDMIGSCLFVLCIINALRR